MTTAEAFRLGFFLRCAESGMNPGEVQDHVQRATTSKQASDLGAFLGHLGGLGIGAAVLAPPIVGYGAGVLGAKAMEDEASGDELKKKELIAEYRRLAARARMLKKLRDLKAGGQIA